MNATQELPEPDLIDRIANALPADIRADYYRELRHCRSLPENDEMLRILRAMQFSVALIVEAPARMAVERERLEQILAGAIETLQEIRHASEDQYARLDRRMAQIPAEIAEGISPKAIAATINESLRQQFTQSTIPETANALAVAAAQIKKSTAEFGSTATALGNSYDGAARDARNAIRDLESTASHAIGATKRGAEELLHVFHEEYRWSLYAFITLALIIGMGIGMWLKGWMDRPVQHVDQAPVVQSAPAINPPAIKHKTKP